MIDWLIEIDGDWSAPMQGVQECMYTKERGKKNPEIDSKRHSGSYI